MEHLHSLNSTIVRTEMDSDAEAVAPLPDGRLHPHGDPIEPPPAEASWLVRDWRYAILRAGMATLSRLAPARAADLFDRIWFTPPRTRPGTDAARWLARGEPIEILVHARPVRAWSWGEGPAVLLVHGWGGNAGQMRAIAGALLERGLRVVAFDAPAHGASGPSRMGGGRVSMIEIADALRVVAASAGPLAGLVAHSGGCTATALALREGWTGPDRIAFIAPFSLPSQAIVPFGRAIGASASVTSMFGARVERRFSRPWTDFDIPPLPRLRALPPLLVVHDERDREVPLFHGQAVAHAWPDAHMVRTRGLGHRRILRDEAVLSDVAGFIARSQAPVRGVPARSRAELDQAYAASGLVRNLR